MKEQRVRLETAKLAKEKGFDILVKAKYIETEEHTLVMGRGGDCIFPYLAPRILENAILDQWDTEIAKAPTQSLLQKWLREHHEIILFVQHETIDDAESAFTWNIKINVPEGVEGTSKKKEYHFWKYYYSFSDEMMWWKTYEEALEKGLIKALKLIKYWKQ